MKLLKIKLGDGNAYTFSTFSILEQKKLKADFDKLDEVRSQKDDLYFVKEDGKFKTDEKGDFISKELSEQDKEILKNIQQDEIRFMMNILRASLCKNHGSFVLTEDKEKNKQLFELLENIIDQDDLNKIVRFTFSGNYLRESQIIDTTVSE